MWSTAPRQDKAPSVAMNVIERRYWQVLILAFVVVFLVLAIRIYRVESPSLVLALFLFPLIAAMARRIRRWRGSRMH